MKIRAKFIYDEGQSEFEIIKEYSESLAETNLWVRRDGYCGVWKD